MRKKILIAATNYWSSPYQVGSHHYAKIFAMNGWDVFFVSDPISPFHFLRKDKNELIQRYNIYKNKIKSGIENIEIYVPMALFTPNEMPFFNTKFVSKYWNNFTIPNIMKVAKEHGFLDVDVLWFDSITQYFWINKLNYKKSILRIADLSGAFKKINKNLKNLEEDLKSKVNNIIYSAHTLKKYLSGYEDKAFYISNGVDINHFLNTKKEIPADLKNIQRPIAIYVGAIDEWFGVEFLREVAISCKDISFVLIGNPKINLTKLKDLKNIYFLGKKDYKDIPSYMYNSDVGIIPFNINHPVVKTVNPIKLYEYMACGLPVVAVKWEELELINSPALLSDNVKDFSTNLKIAIKNGKDKDYINYAKQHSWEESYKKIIELLNIN